jgi:hypothetical protein
MKISVISGFFSNFTLKMHPTAATVRNVNKNLQTLESAYSACKVARIYYKYDVFKVEIKKKKKLKEKGREIKRSFLFIL